MAMATATKKARTADGAGTARFEPDVAEERQLVAA